MEKAYFNSEIIDAYCKILLLARQLGPIHYFDEQETRARLNVDVQRAYLNALFNARLADIQRRGVELATARLDQLQQLQSAGRAARYDVLRARVERANLEPLAIQAENDRELSILDLKRQKDDAPFPRQFPEDDVR